MRPTKASRLGFDFNRIRATAGADAAPPGLIQRKCVKCEDEDEASAGAPVQRYAAATDRSTAAPPIVGDVLAEPGEPLDPGVRGRMEAAFGHDFSAVRVHTDARADAAAGGIDALAFTSGAHIVFGAGQYAPRSRAGQWLIAHELAHTVQQRGERGRPARRPAVGPAGGALEREADAAADAAMAGRSVNIRGVSEPALQRFAPCRYILDAAEREFVAESDVQANLAVPMRSLGPSEREFPIPAGSFSAWRDEDRRRGTVRSQQIGGRAGRGSADIALMQGSVMEVLEIKRGQWDLITDAEAQALNYVEKGKQNLPFLTNRWQARGHAGVTVSDVRMMPMNRLPITSPARIGSVPVSIAWCRDGLVSFKAIGNQDPDIYACGTDVPGTNRFIDGLLGRAEGALDRYFEDTVNPRLDRAIQTMPIRQAIVLALRDPRTREIVQRALGATGSFVLDWLPVEQLADLVESRLQGALDRQIRIVVRQFKDRVIGELRTRARQALRQWLQTSLNALCAAAAAGAAITAADVLRELRRRFGQILADALPAAVKAVALALARELLSELGRALLDVLRGLAIVVGIVVAAIVLWEVAAVIAAGATLAEIGAAIAGLLSRLIPLIPALA
ncbi:eCIS core domain-containing protein [Sorangium sp. So ce145]|uniref:eCIS core domain-containing protein n=1 Tax=Sorangium sp. So ce145 TaxID=3133285 RepID=UPI003F60F9F6